MSEEYWSRENGQRSQSADDQVRSRLLDRAIEHVESVGLTLGIGTTQMQELLDAAEVTAQEFAQLWGTPESFLGDLCRELANQAQVDRADTQTLLTTWQYISSRAHELNTVFGRRSVLIDVIRTAAEYNFTVVTASSKWRTYAALSTTILSWPDDERRTRVLNALKDSELAFVETMENFYRNVLPTLGYRLKPAFANDLQPFVVASASVIEGLGIVRSTVPSLVEAHFELPMEHGTESWSVSALTFMSVIDAFFEPDPEYNAQLAIARLSGGMDVTPSTA